MRRSYSWEEGDASCGRVLLRSRQYVSCAQVLTWLLQRQRMAALKKQRQADLDTLLKATDAAILRQRSAKVRDCRRKQGERAALQT
mmetsp:Transcript_37203/g.69417  ORF Transcript_37203/g.69417 Transcript_37203/m.69417 type:complete len:86 (-) Transcript_37203:2-259(-)